MLTIPAEIMTQSFATVFFLTAPKSYMDLFCCPLQYNNNGFPVIHTIHLIDFIQLSIIL